MINKLTLLFVSVILSLTFITASLQVGNIGQEGVVLGGLITSSTTSSSGNCTCSLENVAWINESNSFQVSQVINGSLLLTQLNTGGGANVIMATFSNTTYSTLGLRRTRDNVAKVENGDVLGSIAFQTTNPAIKTPVEIRATINSPVIAGGNVDAKLDFIFINDENQTLNAMTILQDGSVTIGDRLTIGNNITANGYCNASGVCRDLSQWSNGALTSYTNIAMLNQTNVFQLQNNFSNKVMVMNSSQFLVNCTSSAYLFDVCVGTAHLGNYIDIGATGSTARFSNTAFLVPANNNFDFSVSSANNFRFNIHGSYKYIMNNTGLTIGNNTQRTDIIINNGNITIRKLNGTGNAYACLDSVGNIYRSALACA